MEYKYLLSKTVVAPHIGHEIAFTEEVTVRCVTCGEDVWRHKDNVARSMKVQKLWHEKMRIEDPERYRKINREKGRARRARMKSDPKTYAIYLAKAKEYNDRAKAKRNGGFPSAVSDLTA
jgi:hypothetical protein